jgi:hypothetical protein
MAALETASQILREAGKAIQLHAITATIACSEVESINSGSVMCQYAKVNPLAAKAGTPTGAFARGNLRAVQAAISR